MWSSMIKSDSKSILRVKLKKSNFSIAILEIHFCVHFGMKKNKTPFYLTKFYEMIQHLFLRHQAVFHLIILLSVIKHHSYDFLLFMNVFSSLGVLEFYEGLIPLNQLFSYYICYLDYIDK